MSLGPMEIILILVVIALIFGARKLPELGKGLGQGIREFKKETNDPASAAHTGAAQASAARPTPVDVPSQQLGPVRTDPITGAVIPERTEERR